MNAVARAHVRKSHRVATATHSGWGTSLDQAETPAPTAPIHKLEQPATSKEQQRMAKRRSKAEIRRAIVAALEDEPKGIGQLEKDTGITDPTLRRNVGDLIAHGLVDSEDPGARGAKFKLTGKDPAAAFSGNGYAPPRQNCSAELQKCSRPTQLTRRGKGVTSASGISMRRSSAWVSNSASPL